LCIKRSNLSYFAYFTLQKEMDRKKCKIIESVIKKNLLALSLKFYFELYIVLHKKHILNFFIYVEISEIIFISSYRHSTNTT